MFKYVIAVAFLSSVALGNFNPFDREWDEDAKAYCIEKCEDYCTNCTEPVRCGEGEKKCGEKPIDPNMSQCTPDDICVPEECECDYLDYNGDTCERLCTVECSEDQIKCGQKQTQTGCLQTISASTKDSIGIILSFATVSAQSNAKMMKLNAQ